MNSCRAEGGAWVDSTCPAPLPSASVSPKFCCPGSARKLKIHNRGVKTHTGVSQFMLDVTQQSPVLELDERCWCDSKATGVTLTPVCSLGLGTDPQHQQCPPGCCWHNLQPWPTPAATELPTARKQWKVQDGETREMGNVLKNPDAQQHGSRDHSTPEWMKDLFPQL